jgi:hypothetical protein
VDKDSVVLFLGLRELNPYFPTSLMLRQRKLCMIPIEQLSYAQAAMVVGDGKLCNNVGWVVVASDEPTSKGY